MRVLISGAGIAGPTLAWFLAKAGARVTVVEKAKSMLALGQNIDVTGSAINVMNKMGLMDEVRKYNTTEKGTQFIDPKGRIIAPFPLKKGVHGSPTNEYEILRGDLAKIIYDASKLQPNTEYLFDTTVNSVISNTDKAVTVELSNGETREYDLLVAADGQWSKLRRQNFPAESITVRDMGMRSVYFTIPRQPEDNDWWNVYVALKSRLITTRPDPHGTIRAMFTMMPTTPAQDREWLDAGRSDRKTQNELVRREFADAGWQAQRLLASMDSSTDFYFQVIQQIKMSSWSRGRIVCLGDAAYAPSPLAGSGTPLAIVGAYVLAGELTKLAPGEHPKRALEAYEKAYRAHVEQTQNVPFFVPGFAHPSGPVGRWVLQSFVKGLSWAVGAYQSLQKSSDGTIDEEQDFKLPCYERFEGEKTLDAR